MSKESKNGNSIGIGLAEPIHWLFFLMNGAVQTSVAWERVEKFVGQFSHDLRNGLNACELQVSLLAEMVSDPEAIAELKQLRQSLAGITKQLQVLRASTTVSKPQMLEYPATDLFEDLRERYARQQPQESSRTVWVSSVNATQTVTVDPEATLSACLELLVNAARFGASTTPIRCSLQTGQAGVVLSVAHEVSEPPALAVERWGMDPLVSTKRGAYGLGLFRARRVWSAQNANLTFEYDADSRTLTAAVTFLSPVA